MNILITTLLIMTLLSPILSYICSSYDDLTTCVTTDHILCAYCVDTSTCAEYNPCENAFVSPSFPCNDIIINTSITSYLETCGIMTIADYCTIIFILVTVLAMLYIIINNNFIKNKREELEKPLNVLFITFCSMIIVVLIIIFTMYRLVLNDITKYYNTLYNTLKYLTIAITVTLLIVITIIIIIIITICIGQCIITKTKDTCFGNLIEKIRNTLNCCNTNKKRDLLVNSYDDINIDQ